MDWQFRAFILYVLQFDEELAERETDIALTVMAVLFGFNNSMTLNYPDFLTVPTWWTTTCLASAGGSVQLLNFEPHGRHGFIPFFSQCLLSLLRIYLRFKLLLFNLFANHFNILLDMFFFEQRLLVSYLQGRFLCLPYFLVSSFRKSFYTLCSPGLQVHMDCAAPLYVFYLLSKRKFSIDKNLAN